MRSLPLLLGEQWAPEEAGLPAFLNGQPRWPVKAARPERTQQARR
ncbi:hypothetical protein ACVPTE_23065 [Salmonella enterica subsp. enterica serovar Winslow]